MLEEIPGLFVASRVGNILADTAVVFAGQDLVDGFLDAQLCSLGHDVSFSELFSRISANGKFSTAHGWCAPAFRARSKNAGVITACHKRTAGMHRGGPGR